MTRTITVCIALVGVLATAPALAHHSPSMLGNVSITQPVMAGGTLLEPGTYELRDTGEHVTPLPGQSEDAQAYVEFVQSGRVVARDVAEMMSAQPSPVGTAGGSRSRPQVQRLKGDEFVRVSAYRGGERYLIHLRVAR